MLRLDFFQSLFETRSLIGWWDKTSQSLSLFQNSRMLLGMNVSKHGGSQLQKIGTYFDYFSVNNSLKYELNALKMWNKNLQHCGLWTQVRSTLETCRHTSPTGQCVWMLPWWISPRLTSLQCAKVYYSTSKGCDWVSPTQTHTWAQVFYLLANQIACLKTCLEMNVNKNGT